MLTVRQPNTRLHLPRIEIALLEWVYWSLFFYALFFVVVGGVTGVTWRLVSGLFGFGVLLYGGFIEPHRLRVVTHRHSLHSDPTAILRVVFLSDFHAGAYKGKKFYDRVAERVSSLHPDLIFLGGDFVEEYASSVSQLASLSRLRAPLGKFFLLGNHDFMDQPERVASVLRQWGYEDLTNRSVEVEKDGRTVDFVGVDEIWFGAPKTSLFKRTSDKPRIIVAHEPDCLLDLQPEQVDLVMTGHTHGGQIRFPWIGTIHPLPQRIPSWIDRGKKEWQGIPIVISQGLGEASSRARIGCPPQIVVVELEI